MKLAFGSDHAGFGLCTQLAEWAQAQGHEVARYGAGSEDSFDYPLAADAVARVVQGGEADFGVLVCGSGIGMEIRANRYSGVRAANCCSDEMAKLARQHNHANVLCLGQRLVSPETGMAALSAFLATEPDSADRHARRVGQLDAPAC